MSLKAGFGEYSLPLNVREHLAVNYPALPRSFINGLRAISKAAFSDSDSHQLARVEHAVDLLQTAEYFAPEFYAHTNSVLPERVLIALAGESELENSEDLDVILPADTRDLLIELRDIAKNSGSLGALSCSVDARFVALVRLYHELDDYLDMQFRGDIELGGDEQIRAIHYHNNLIQNVLDPENSVLETHILDTLRRIDLTHQFRNSDMMWHVGLTRNPDFDEMAEAEILKAAGIQHSETLEFALGLLIEHRKRLDNLDKTGAVTSLAQKELGEIRLLCRHCDEITPSVLAYLLVQNDMDDEEFSDAIITSLGSEGEDIAYLHAGGQDKALYGTLHDKDRAVLNDYEFCVDILDLNWNSAMLNVIDSHDVDYDPLRERLSEATEKSEAAFRKNPSQNTRLLMAMRDAVKAAETALTLADYKLGEFEKIPRVDDIDQRMTPEELRDYIAKMSPTNT